MFCVRTVVNLSAVLFLPWEFKFLSSQPCRLFNKQSIYKLRELEQAVAVRMGGNTRPPAGARQPVQSLAAAVDFATVDFHLFDKEDLFSAPSSQRLGA